MNRRSRPPADGFDEDADELVALDPSLQDRVPELDPELFEDLDAELDLETYRRLLRESDT